MDYTLEKFCVPHISLNSVKRPRITTLIQTLSVRGILFINAPAGYGKTTAAVHWAETKKIKAVWFSMDEYDTSESDFYKGFISALQTGSNETFFSPGETETLPLQRTLELMAKISYSGGIQAVIIDDFQMLNDPCAARSLPILRSRLPADLRFIVISRTQPDNMLNDYIQKETIKQITYDEMSFTDEETVKLLSKHGIRLPPYQAEKAFAKFRGWPAALGALVLAKTDEGKIDVIIKKKGISAFINDCIDKKIFELCNPEMRVMLRKLSICEYITPELCLRLTGHNNSWELLGHFAAKTGMLIRYGSESMRFLKPLRDFLLTEQDAEEAIGKKELYFTAAKWYKENKNIPAALFMSVRSGNTELIEEITRLHSFEYSRYNIGVESYMIEVMSRVRTLPDEVIRNYPRLCMECWFSAHAGGDLEEMKKWMGAVKDYVASGAVSEPGDMFMALFQFWNDPDLEPWLIIDLIKQFSLTADMLPRVNIQHARSIPAFTLTYNMPFYHRAQRDYCEVSPTLDAYMTELSPCLPVILSPYHEVLLLLIEGGVCFERNEMQRAKKCAKLAYEASSDSTPEIAFAAIMFLSEVCWVEGNAAEISALLEKADKLITDSNAFYLTANYNAYTANLGLYKGNADTAGNWLEQNNVCDSDTGTRPELYKIYRDLTTAKSLMLAGKILNALGFLDKIRELCVNFRRPADHIEASVLCSVCLWRLKRPDKAVKMLANAIKSAQALELILPVARYGRDVLPVLQKVVNRIKWGYNEEGIDKAFAGALYITALEFSERNAGFSSVMNAKPVRLSKKQAEILDYLAKNLSFREMSVLTGTKITTVKDHALKLYRKLGVNNSVEALLKARELGLM